MIAFALLLAACGGADDDAVSFRLESRGEADNVLQLWRGEELLDQWEIPYKVVSLSQGDITGDSLPEAAVCVVKPTRHFPDEARRPWLFRIEQGRLIRPLWLGSQLSHPLDSFIIKNGYVLAIERDDDSTWLVARYRQKGFGLKHDAYLGRRLSREEAVKMLGEK